MSVRLLSLTVAMMTALSASHALAGLADIREGVYKAEHDEKQKLFIKQEASAYASNHYAMLSLGAGGARETGLFKVEAVDGSVLSLTRLYISEQSILTTGNYSQPSFSAQMTKDKDGEDMIVLTATDAGRSSGCPSSLRFRLDKDSKQAWTSLSAINVPRLKINRDSEIDMILENNGYVQEFGVTLTGADDLRASWSGNYLVTEQIRGIGLMRKRQLDSMNGSGFSLSRNVETVLVPMRSESGRPSLRFVRMSAGDSRCTTPSSTIK